MTNNPAERLRNLLSPFLNVASLLALKQVEIKTDNPTLTKIIEKDIKLCAETAADVRYYLDKAAEVIDESGFTTTEGLDYEFLRKKLDNILANSTKEELEEWLKMDKKRMDGLL
jgi:hypothetical protein